MKPCYELSHTQEQSARYWPMDKLRQHGDLFVELTQVQDFPTYTMRELSITNTKVMFYYGLQCFTMVYYGLQCFTMVYYGLQCFTMVYYGLQCFTMVYYGLQCFTMVYCGLLWFTNICLPVPPVARARSMKVVWCVSINTLTGRRTTAQSTQLPSSTSSGYSRRRSTS